MVMVMVMVMVTVAVTVMVMTMLMSLMLTLVVAVVLFGEGLLILSCWDLYLPSLPCLSGFCSSRHQTLQSHPPTSRTP